MVGGCTQALSRIQAFVRVILGQLRAVQALRAASSAIAAGMGGFRWQNINATARSVLESTLSRLRIRR